MRDPIIIRLALTGLVVAVAALAWLVWALWARVDALAARAGGADRRTARAESRLCHLEEWAPAATAHGWTGGVDPDPKFRGERRELDTV